MERVVDQLGDVAHDVSRVMEHVFGGWSNAMGGFLGNAVGSAVGVYGAYRIATHQMRHERAERRTAVAGEAAASIRASMLDLPTMIERLANVDPNHDYDQTSGGGFGLSDWWQQKWRGQKEAYQAAVNLSAHLLPKRLATPVSDLSKRMDEVLVYDVDDEMRIVISVDPADQAVLTEIRGLAETCLDQLTAYAAKSLGDS